MSDHPSLAELDGALPFADRHIGLRPDDIATMLERLGFDSLDDADGRPPSPAASGRAEALDLPGAAQRGRRRPRAAGDRRRQPTRARR